MNRLVLGCGYLGLRVARLWKSQGDEVYAVTRCQNNAELMKQEGIIPLIADITEPKSVSRLPKTDTVLFSVGMDRKKYDSVHNVYVNGLKNVLSGISEVPSQFIYISSTGVYGNFDGAWIDENSPTAPQGKEVRLALPRKRFFETVVSQPNPVSLDLPASTARNACPPKH